jgi:hypothetical protein
MWRKRADVMAGLGLDKLGHNGAGSEAQPQWVVQ